VYVLFNGRDAASPDDIDLFLSWTNTAADVTPPAGPKFQSSAAGRGWDVTRKTYRISDALLARAGEYDPAQRRLQQFMARVAIDDLGGINLWFECAVQELVSPPPSTHTNIRYARWASRADLEAGNPPFLWVSNDSTTPWFTFLGHDYNGFTLTKCVAYSDWAEYDSTTGTWQIKVVRIALPCAADVDQSGDVDAADAVAFANAYIAAQPPADVNQDAAINAQDVTDFVTAYTCGVCPLPPH
jgi:hypothetical protein